MICSVVKVSKEAVNAFRVEDQQMTCHGGVRVHNLDYKTTTTRSLQVTAAHLPHPRWTPVHLPLVRGLLTTELTVDLHDIKRPQMPTIESTIDIQLQW